MNLSEEAQGNISLLSIHVFLYSTLSLQVANEYKNFLYKLQDNDTLRSYEMTAIFQKKTIVNFPLRYFLAKLENILRYFKIYMYLMNTRTCYIFIIP